MTVSVPTVKPLFITLACWIFHPDRHCLILPLLLAQDIVLGWLASHWNGNSIALGYPVCDLLWLLQMNCMSFCLTRDGCSIDFGPHKRSYFQQSVSGGMKIIFHVEDADF